MIQSIKRNALPGLGDTKEERERSAFQHYVWALVDAVSIKEPGVLKLFDVDNDVNLEEQAEILERIYKGESVSMEELAIVLGGRDEDGFTEDVRW